MATIRELLIHGKDVLEQSGNEYAKYERKVLLEEVLGIPYMQMLLREDEQVEQSLVSRYEDLLLKRTSHYPLQYILGYAHFMDYTFYVNEKVLIPRNDTEVLVELANDIIHQSDVFRQNQQILDLCCGSGCIGISLKLYHDNIALTLSDVSKDALMVAQRNVDKYEIEACIIESNLFEKIDSRYGMIISNPPYIESQLIETLSADVKDYEPRLALDGGEDGMKYYNQIIDLAPYYLCEHGYLFFEIGYNQGEKVSKRMQEKGFLDVTVKKDYAGLNRVVFGHL